MNLLESIRLALEGISANRLRSFLTTLGIVIGIAAVIAVVAVGQGGRAMLMSEMEKAGTNIFAVFLDWRKENAFTGREFTLQDVEVIKERVPEVSHLSPVSNSNAEIRGPGKTKSSVVFGVSSDYGRIRNLSMKGGHFFSPGDDQGRRRVAVMDQELADELFGRSDPLGQKVVIKNTPFAVVGVIAEGESMMGFQENPKVYIPFHVWQQLFGQQIYYLEGSASSKEQVDAAVRNTIKVLERRHNAPGHYKGESMEQYMKVAKSATGIVTLTGSSF